MAVAHGVIHGPPTESVDCLGFAELVVGPAPALGSLCYPYPVPCAHPSFALTLSCRRPRPREARCSTSLGFSPSSSSRSWSRWERRDTAGGSSPIGSTRRTQPTCAECPTSHAS